MPIRLSELSWKSPVLFDLQLPREVIEKRFGPPDVWQRDSNGIGLYDAWLMRFGCNLEVALRCYYNPPQRLHPKAHHNARSIEVYASRPDRAHILAHLRLPAATLMLYEPDHSTVGPRTWVVMRLDDNNNEFEVSRHSSLCEAEMVANTYEARGHKQSYWVDGPYRAPLI